MRVPIISRRPLSFRLGFLVAGALLTALAAAAAALAQGPAGTQAAYTKHDYFVPMRDGVRLFTSVYVPKDASRAYPIMLTRTPYSVGPYGPEAYPSSLGPSQRFADDGFIFAYQDVRGRFKSDGEWEQMRPQVTSRRGALQIDESTEAYDTIDWLVKNVPNNSGRVGMWGVSYPGFYTAAGMIRSHPALKAASPQAPIADWFIGDDFHHNGAFFLFDAFDFMAWMGRPRPQPTEQGPERFKYETQDAYRFFLEMGPLRNANDRHLNGGVPFWNELMRHGEYDEFWKERNLLPHLQNVRAAVLTVGGWFDAEDLYGPLRIYDRVERANPGTPNSLVMGPWWHGGWSSGEASELHGIQFGSRTSHYYQNEIEFPFFAAHLKGRGTGSQPEARVFQTGANRWLDFDNWPPRGRIRRSLYFHAGGRLAFEPPSAVKGDSADEYVSDPAKPVPYTAATSMFRGVDYMIEDQRFAARRPDVLVYQTPPLSEDLSVAGPLDARLSASTTGTDADFVVKLIDVFPEDAPEPASNPRGVPMAGYQMLVRAEVMRAKYRRSFEKPEALSPGKITPIDFELRDVCHTFRKGHRIMVQVQSSWFPLVDRNPQTFTDIYRASASEFRKATHRVYRSPAHASRLEIGVLPN